MLKLNLQLFGGRGSSSGGGEGGRQFGGSAGGNRVNAQKILETITSVDMGYMVNPIYAAYKSLYELIKRGEPFHPNNDEARVLNGFIINYGIEGRNILSYSQSLDLNVAQIWNKSQALRMFSNYIKEKLNNPNDEFSAYRIAKQELERQRNTRPTRRQR